MDTTAIIIGLCLFLFALMLAIIVSERHKRKRLNFKRKIDECIAKNGLQLTDQEDVDGKFIGIDSVSQKLIFVSMRECDVIVIDLQKDFILDLLRSKDNSQIDLRFTVKGDTETEFNLPFFDPAKDNLLHFEYYSQKAERWFKLINHY